MLHWLGLTTLADFTRLPTADVQQRFGKAGKLAHAWARGLDRRPVPPTTKTAPETIRVDLDAPTTSQTIAPSATMQALKPTLHGMASRLEGCRRLRVELIFLDGATQVVTHSFVEPLSETSQIQSGIAQALRAQA